MTAALPLVLTVFVACAVEATEALTIVLASGLTREWRSTFQGMAAALLVLAAVVAVLGPTITLLPLTALRLVVGALLAIFGLQWLRKAILRAAGYKALHDEASAFLREVAAAKAAPEVRKRGVNDWYAFTLSFKGVLLEGLEVVFIVITFGGNQRNLGAAVAGCRDRRGGRDRDRDRGPGPAGQGAGERAEVRGGDHADVVRHVLGRGGSRGDVAGRRRRAAGAGPGGGRGLARLRGLAAPRAPAQRGRRRSRAAGGAAGDRRGDRLMIRTLKSFGAFWYDFVIGDDWYVAAIVVTALGLTALLTHAAGVNAWWLLPVAAFAALAWSLRRATGGKP